MRGVPVVSAPKLQECTNSHAFGIMKTIGVVGPGLNREDWPVSAEEYAVLAMRLQVDKQYRALFMPPMNENNIWANPNRHEYKGLRMIVDLGLRLQKT